MRPTSPPPPRRTDSDLMAAHVEGDPAAFPELVRRHRTHLWRDAVRILGHREDAEDALQEALARALRHAGSYRGEAAVDRWLHRIVVNVALTAARRRAQREVRDVVSDPAPCADPADTVDDAALVREAVRGLAPALRETYVLAVLLGYSTEAVAAVTRVPPGTVKSRLWRARGQLSGILDEVFWSGSGDAVGPGRVGRG